MKKILIVILIVISLPAISQTFPKGLPSPSSNGYSKIGYSRMDSGMIMSARDTFAAVYPTMILWSGDNNYWATLGGGNSWHPVVSSGLLRGIYAGYGLTKINDSTLRVDSNSVATRLRVQQGIDSLGQIVALKLNISDTAAMLNAYKVKDIAQDAAILLKINISDSAAMLTPYLRKYDTTAMLSNYYNKTASDGRFQPLENQRLSTFNAPTFGNITGSGIITLSNTGTSLTQWRAANPINASGRIGVVDAGTYAGLFASYNTSNQRVGYIGDSAGGMKYVAEIGTHNFNANVNVTADVNAVNINLTNKITADSFKVIGGTAVQLIEAAGGVITAGTGITISGGTISASGSFTYNTTDPNGSNGQSYTPANYPAALLMGGLYGGYLAITTNSYTVNGNYRFIELKTGAANVGISSTASGQEFYLANTTGSAISISFTLKDLTGSTLTTVPANTSYHIFYNGTNYLKL